MTDVPTIARALVAFQNAGGLDAEHPAFAAVVESLEATGDEDIAAALAGLKERIPYLFADYHEPPKPFQPLEKFNPGGGAGPAETAGQRVTRLQRTSSGSGGKAVFDHGI